MNDKAVTDANLSLEIDGQSVTARPGQMVIEVTDAHGIYVPRFCYHKKLSVAANCRMCLVEVEKAPKPLPACATPVAEGMKVQTRSRLTLEAQRSVMEFLLINHPLDCPICDQGGECELQDLALGYGKDVSRYQESKRVVQDKNIGPLIQTDMTRCIHCTRCVRFGEEIAGLRDLGVTGRGEFMEIGTYVEKSIASELSGNMIDVCPVGALTSKPFRYSARAWELTQHEGIAPHDSVGSNLHFHVKDDRVMRVAPAANEAINEVWLSDRDRFSYEGLYAEDRLREPLIKQDGHWRTVEWDDALAFVVDQTRALLETGDGDGLGGLASPTATLEELYLFQKLLRGLGCNHIDSRLRQHDFGMQEADPPFPYLGRAIASLEAVDCALVIGADVRLQQPLINHRLRKAALKGASMMMVNAVGCDLNYRVDPQIVTAPETLPTTLAAILKALIETRREARGELDTLLQRIEIGDPHRAVADQLIAAQDGVVLLGNAATAHAQYATLKYLAQQIAKRSGLILGFLGEAANTSGAHLAGALPHRGAGGVAVDQPGLAMDAMLETPRRAYWLLGIEPEHDCGDGAKALAAMRAADCVVAMTAYQTETMRSYADVLLPIALFAENSGTYVNAEGRSQRFRAAVTPFGAARPAWKILRVLAHSLALGEAFPYTRITQVSDEVTALIDAFDGAIDGRWRAPDRLTSDTTTPAASGSATGEVPIYRLDPLVRRATALQAASKK